MNHNHIIRVFPQPVTHLHGWKRIRLILRKEIIPGSYRVSKLEHLLEGRHVVVVDEDSLDPAVEEGGVVRLLAAQVEHLVPEREREESD